MKLPIKNRLPALFFVHIQLHCAKTITALAVLGPLLPNKQKKVVKICASRIMLLKLNFAVPREKYHGTHTFSQLICTGNVIGLIVCTSVSFLLVLQQVVAVCSSAARPLISSVTVLTAMCDKCACVIHDPSNNAAMFSGLSRISYP